MPAAIPVVASVAAGVAASQGATAIALAITIAAQVATQALTKKPSLDAYRDNSERKQVLRAAASPKTVVYGRTLSAGTLFFAEEQAGTQTDGEMLHLAITLAGHPLSSTGKVLLGDDEIGIYGDYATYEVHNDRQTADPYMLANCASWKPDMVGRGIAWLRLSLKFNAEKFPSGIPNVRVEKFGRAVYDPRTGLTGYSNNAALCILDYYRNYLKVPDSEINFDQFQEAANISDELVSRADGTMERRYTLNGEFDLSENKASILDAMLAACAGEPTYVGGKHGILVGAYYGPATEVITESQIAGDIEIMPEVSQSERVNTINGTFIDPQQNDSEVDFPAVSVSEWVAEDGVEISQDLKLRFVTSEFQAQRLADIRLKRTRISRTMNVPLNLSGYRYRPGMYVKVNFPSLGIVDVEMRVTDWKFGVQNGVQLTLKQETADVWGDAIGKPITRPDFTQLSPGGAAQPQNLRYTVEEIGQVVQGVLSWQNVGQVAYNQVIIRRDGVPVLSIQVPGSFTRLTGLLRDTYTAHVVAVSYTGGHSPEAYLEFSIEAPPPPNKVDVEQGYFAITLIPRLAEITNVSTQFDFWTSGETRLADASTATVEANASRAGMGAMWTSNELQIDHTYYWYIRTINAFGASAFVEVAAVCTTDTGDLLDQIAKEISGSEAFRNLERIIDTSTDAIIENALANDADVQRRRKQDGKVSAEILRIDTLILTNDSAYAEKFEQLTAVADENSAAVQQVSSAYADLNGKLSAQWGAKVQVDSNGQAYVAGMQLGVEGNGGNVQSYFLVSANTMGFYNPYNGSMKLAMAIKNGQVFLNEALIDYASITLAKIGSWYSANYVPRQTGTMMSADGSFEVNGSISGSGRLMITNNLIACYDGAGNIKIKLGYLK
ncbi:phage tail tip protein J-related protein [Franconibacter daqui]|uniref:phage tail tip protein J-related protein n=1 Tax=Franconibacter daqui TaxID=2047724 RepID=UPI0030D5898C